MPAAIYPGYQTVFARDVVTTGQAAGTVTGTFTASVPNGTVAGDYLLMVFSVNKDAVTTPSGWTQLQNGVAATLAHQSFVYGKVANSTDAGGNTYAISCSGVTAAPDCCVVWAFGGVDSTKVVSAVSTENTTSSSQTSPAVSITVPSLMWHGVVDRRGTTPALVWTFPSGTKTEVTNDGTVGYTASGAPAASMAFTTGSQAGVSITTTAIPSTSYAYQVGLGALNATKGPEMFGQDPAITRASRW